MDDDHAVTVALTSFLAANGSELDLSLEQLITRWSELLTLHFSRYLAGHLSMQEQRRARICDLFAESRPGCSPEAADRLFAIYENDYRAAWRAYPDAPGAISALSASKLAVLSNGDQKQQTEKLQTCGLATCFSRILTSSEIGCAKPEPEAFVRACRHLGVPARECVYVGDSLENDARASAAAGLAGVWLDRRASQTEAGPGIRVIHSSGELPVLLAAEP